MPADDTLNEQAKLLYADNNITESFNALLSIPEEERTAENWLLLGNILQDKGRNDDAVIYVHPGNTEGRKILQSTLQPR